MSIHFQDHFYILPFSVCFLSSAGRHSCLSYMEREGRLFYAEMALKNEQKWGRASTVYSLWNDETQVCLAAGSCALTLIRDKDNILNWILLVSLTIQTLDTHQNVLPVYNLMKSISMEIYGSHRSTFRRVGSLLFPLYHCSNVFHASLLTS